MAKRKINAHPGFAAVARKIARKEGVGIKTANRILGAANARNGVKTRHRRKRK